MNYPSDRFYHSEHTWLLLESNNEALIGITYFAQEVLGDIVEIDCPTPNSLVSKGVSCGTLESRKAISDIISPTNGVVIEINDALIFEPYLVNDDCYDKGWIARIKLVNPLNDNDLMNERCYRQHIGE
jgi:glycine cleavage system H protein